MTLDLKNMPFGFLNPDLTQRSVKGSVSRRRTEPDKLQSNHMASIATGDCLKDKLQYPGVVMSSRMTKFSRSGTQMAFRSPAEGFETQFKNYVYRVHMRDLMGYPDPTSLEDPKVHTMTEARLDLTALSSLSAFGDANNNYDLTSRMVLIEFDNPRLFTGPRIVSVGAYVDVAIFEEFLQNKMVGSQAPTGGDQATPGPFTTVEGGGAGADTSCVSYKRSGKNGIGMSYVHGSDYQTGKRLHNNSWTSGWPTNTVSNWLLPVKPGEGKKAATSNALRASSGINRSNGNAHDAIDISGPAGTPLYAVQDAKVTSAPRSMCRNKKDGPDKIMQKRPSTCGNELKYKTIEGYVVGYCHLDNPALVKKGDIIKKGQLVGYMGDTGSSTGPHLHWSVKKGGKILHPADFYPSGWILLKESTNPLVETRRNMTAYPTHTPSKAVTNPVV